MAMRYGYFDSEITGVDSEGMPIFDRAETSELFRLLFAKLLTNSVREAAHQRSAGQACGLLPGPRR